MNYRRTLSAIFLLLVINLTSHAQTNVLTPYNIFNIKNVTQVTISPDMNYAAYTINVPRSFSDKPGGEYRELHIVSLSDGSSKTLLSGKVNVSSINWRNDSKHITFLARLEEEKTTSLYQQHIEGDKPEKIFSAQKSISSYQFSNDEKYIAYISESGKDKRKEELLERGFDAEIYEEEYSDLNLYVYNLASREIKQLTKNVSVFAFEINPDGKTIATQIADKNLVDDSYMMKRIFLVDAEKGTMSKLIDNPGKLSSMSWSPDGKHIAFVAGANINDAVSGSLFIIPSDNKKKFTEVRNYSEGFVGSVTDVNWLDNNTVVFSSEEGVYTTLRKYKIGGAESELMLEPGKVTLYGFSVQKSLIAINGNAPDHPLEAFLFDTESGQLDRLTNSNPWLENIKLAKQERVAYKARDGLEIEGVLIYPLNFQEGKRYPLITYIHGGPEACEQNGWNTSYGKWGQIAAAKDYFFFLPNYRASSGRGVEFTMMGFGDLAGKEFDDVIDGIDYLIDKGYVEKNKVGIGGGSYGGYFSAWAATKHSERFAAAVVFVGIANQLSKANTTDIPLEDYYVHWGIYPHENFELYLDRSPVKYASNNKTPTLILVGKEDPRVHPSQSLELYRTLKLHGKAPVRLIQYPGEGHGNRRNTSRLDYAVRTMQWFDYYLKGEGDPKSMPDKYIDFEIE